MNIYKISQNENTGYDSYDSAIVAAETPDIAKRINPDTAGWPKSNDESDTWCNSPDEVEVVLIGTAVDGTKEGIILASFNGG